MPRKASFSYIKLKNGYAVREKTSNAFARYNVCIHLIP